MRLRFVVFPEVPVVEDFMHIVDRISGWTPALTDITLYPSIHDPVLPQDPASPFSHVGLLALQRYAISTLFVHAGLTLLGSQGTLRKLDITMKDHDSTALRESLLADLERSTLHRLRRLVLVNHARHLPLDFAPRILAACPTARTLELDTSRLFPEVRGWLDEALRTPGLLVSTLIVSTNLHSSDDTVHTLLSHVPHMLMLRTLVLRCAGDSGDAGLERLSHACRTRRIAFIQESE